MLARIGFDWTEHQAAPKRRGRVSIGVAGVTVATLGAAVLTLGIVVGSASAKGGGGGGGGAARDGGAGGGKAGIPLSSLAVPQPTNLSAYVRDQGAAVALGKALFWDMQVGSDGMQACASCHFQAGADGRVMNTVNPGSNDGNTFSAGHGPNAQLRADEFPFHKLANPDDPRSAVAYDSNDVVGSQGVTDRTNYSGVIAGTSVDDCLAQADPVYHVGSQNVRRVTGRQAPTNINAVFQRNDFWDGRASHIFNGANPRGVDGGNPSVYKTISGLVTPVHIQIDNGALASQATGPGLSPFEMSCDGRIWPAVGHKLFGLQPLGEQAVASDDSVLGAYSNAPGTGLQTGYLDMIKAAFQPQWVSDKPVVINGQTYSQTEANFSLFWGLSIQLYESTLVSNKTAYDAFAAGNTSALTAEQQRGLDVFDGKGKCAKCHTGPVFTDATDTSSDGFAGFHATGVRPLAEDAGAGGTPVNRAQDAGKFKTPTLRNIELTGPYMHNGGMATLEQVVEFYNRGGDFHDNDNIDHTIKQLDLKPAEKQALLAFMVSLTDERVRQQSAPFDHPQLYVADGASMDGGTMRDNLIEIAATGRNGGSALPTFQDSLGLQP